VPEKVGMPVAVGPILRLVLFIAYF
jgi:hypothetical protein